MLFVDCRGRGVRRCDSDWGTGCGRDLRQPEIQNLGVAALGDEDVRGLDVAVDDAFGMRGVECIGNLNRQTEQNIVLERFSGDAMLQRHAVQKLHGDECLPVLFPNVINRADIGVIQRRCGLRFALKAR